MTTRRRLVIATAAVAILVGSLAVTGSVLGGAAEREQRPRLIVPVPLQVPPGVVRALRAPLPIQRRHVGRGADAAVVAYRGDVSAPRPLVVFLHGWGLAVRDYRAWIDHLVRRGATVVAPRYQTTRRADPAGVQDAARRGLERALRELTPAGDVMVLAGHSAGGALAADLAVSCAADPEMPRVRGVFAVYPGRAILGYPGGIPAAPLDELGANLALRVLAGANDGVVGEAPAQEMVSAAANVEDRRLVRVTEPSVSDHFAPLEASAAARRAFWSPLDQIVFGR